MKKILFTGIMALSLSLGACDSYLDINVNPNSPQEKDLTPDLIFPGAEMAFANSYGDYLRITGGYFAQHYSQYFGTSNYLDYSQFTQSATRSSGTYTNLSTRCLQNMALVIAKSKAEGNTGNILAATVIRAAAYQAMVDCYGEIPYSEALDVTNLTPKYDDGKDVYAGIIAELDEAMANVSGSEKICVNNLLPDSRASEWIKVANALKLRLLMRESNAVDVKAQLAALVAENNFPTEDIAWENCWKNESGQANPFYQEEFATYFGSTQTNVILNLALFRTMEEGNDARLRAFFSPNTAKSEYHGGVSGTNFSTTKSYKANYWCRPKMRYDDPVYFISRFETEFFLAEYEARFGSQAAAAEHYEEAVRASFESAGTSGADAVLEAYPYDPANWAKCIGIQKWVALSGTNNFEAYCELRRLKYPAFGSVSGSDIYNDVTDSYNPSLLEAGTLYTPIKLNGDLQPNTVLQRWPYPSASSSRNDKTPPFVNSDFGKPVFWAK